jgi:hypothetical protein
MSRAWPLSGATRRREIRSGRHQPDRIGLDLLVEGMLLGLAEQNHEDGRGVDHHQLGIPRSS